MKNIEKTKEQFLKEISLLKAKITELEKNKEFFQIIAENTSDNIGITTFDLKAKYIYVSPSVKSVLGYDPEDLLGKSFFDFIHPEDKKVLFPMLKKYIKLKVKKLLTGKKSPISELIEFRFKNKAGNWRFMQSTVNIAGKQLLAVTRDITERKQAEERLINFEERFRQITENSQEWIWEVDSNGLYTFASHVMENMLGYKLEEIVNKKHFYDLFHPEDREELKNAALGVFKQRQPFREFINRNVTKIGEIIWLSTSGVPILDNNGNLLGYRGADTNITERKKAEEELRKYREHLEELVKERTQKLEEQKKELERLNHLFVNREFRIKELRDKVKELEGKISDKSS